MKDFRNYYMVRIVTEEGTIANGDYILDGVTIRTRNGLLNDNLGDDGKFLPAIEVHDGSHIEHWANGALHCDYEPAVIDTADNYELWFRNGQEVTPER